MTDTSNQSPNYRPSDNRRLDEPSGRSTTEEAGSTHGADTAREVRRGGPLPVDQQHEGVVQPDAGSRGGAHGPVPAGRKRQDEADALDESGALPEVARRRVQSGWYVVKPSLVGNLDHCQTIYSWDPSEPHTSAVKAVSAGWEEHGHDDWNLVHVRDGAITWFGWMDDEFTQAEDRAEIADALGLPLTGGSTPNPTEATAQNAPSGESS